MSRNTSRRGSRSLSASARSELSNAPKGIGAWKDSEETIGQLANADAERYETLLENVDAGGANRFAIQDANQTYDRQMAYSDKGFDLARSIGNFIEEIKKYDPQAMSKKPRFGQDGIPPQGAEVFYQSAKTIDKVMNTSWNDVVSQAFEEMKGDIARAYKKDVGENATDEEVRDIFKNEISPRLDKVKLFVDKSIFDSVNEDKYSPTKLYQESKRLHKSEIYDTSLDNNYNRSVMNMVNTQADKYIKQFQKKLNSIAMDKDLNDQRYGSQD